MKPRLTVQVFSMIADSIGRRQIDIDIDLPTTGGQILRRLATAFPIVGEMESVVRIAVNREYVDLDTVVSDGDEVALITPTSGG